MKSAVVATCAAACFLLGSRDVSAAEDPWFASDKYLHGSVSAALALGGYAGGAAVDSDGAWPWILGVGFPLVAGAGKEVVDLWGPGDASWRDMTWNLLGAASGLLVAFVVDEYVF